MGACQPPLFLLLAAGASQRMGTPKALLDWFGAPLVARHLQAASGLATARVVLGCDPGPIAAVLPPGVGCVDPAWASTDMSARVRFGLRGHRGPALVAPIDTAPSRGLLLALLAVGPPAVPLDREGRRGHPVYLDERAGQRLLAGESLRAVTAAARGVATGSATCALDMDTLDDWRRVQAAAWRDEGPWWDPPPRRGGGSFDPRDGDG